MKKNTRKLSMLKFASIAIYYTLITIGLTELTRLYSYSVLANITTLADPLVFSFAVMFLGLFVSFLYRAVNAALNTITYVYSKKYIGGLCRLKPTETSFIAIVSCIIVGFVLMLFSSDHPEFKVVYRMIFSLPLTKIAFISSNLKDILSEIKQLFHQSITVWLFVAYVFFELALLLLFEEYATIINGILIVLGIMLSAIHSVQPVS